MARALRTTSLRWRVSARLGRWLLLGTAVVQAVGPALIPFGGSANEPPVVPAGYAFSIWGVILLGCLASAALGLPERLAATDGYRAAHLPLSATQVLFVVWLLAATSPQVWLTLPVFAAMLALTLVALRGVLASRGRATGREERRALTLLAATLGLYAGWSTAAVWVNLATLLTDAGLSTAGGAGTAWQSAVVVTACAAAVALTRALGAPLPYVAAVAWAFVAVVVSALGAGVPVLAAVAATGVAVVVVVAAATRRAGGPSPRTA